MNSLIAPCGMNCGICMAYLRKKNICPGCRGSDKDKSVSRSKCKIKNCDKSTTEFCFDCEEFPCKKLNHLDKRYRTKYRMSMIENLITINNSGIRKFLENENRKWTCLSCGGTICAHKGICYNCGKIYYSVNPNHRP
ncbi:MAG: DUF3795 domain-containing protein [Bacteroidetes bacterium]|nr:DUF3795 domain-containing protein [Bacteroidota bacterium]